MGRTRGFTIVELLIVIVVIAILAAITLVAYNGISERARVSAATSHAAQLKRANLNEAAYWSFDECSGSTVSTSGGVTAPTTVSGTLTWSSDTPSGTGCSLSFNGATRLSAPVTLSATYYLKAAWVKITNCTTGNNIISRGDGTNMTDAAFYAPGCLPQGGHNATFNSVTYQPRIDANKWYYLALEYENGVMRLFVDGKVVSTATGVPAPNNLTIPGINIGAHSTGNYFTGLIDEPIIIVR